MNFDTVFEEIGSCAELLYQCILAGMNNLFLPISLKDLQERRWSELDIIILTGDAYVDHPSYGTAIIGRYLESKGFKVGIIAQPNWNNTADFMVLGRPKLFFGVTSGNLDSMVANYTATKKRRQKDLYSPGGKTNLRPDRACIVYTNRIKEAYPGIPVILGGLEASLRRFAHYDYWSNSVRRSILLDSKADAIVYSMGEKQIFALAKHYQGGGKTENIPVISGIAIKTKDIKEIKNTTSIPSFEEVKTDLKKFNSSFKTIYTNSTDSILVQQHENQYIVQYKSPDPLTTEELDGLYSLPFTRKPHPIYTPQGGIPGFETIKFSLISQRGCPGECSFCSISLHQGRIVQSRSEKSILTEIKHLTTDPEFKGTISDLGGPTANLYQAQCPLWEQGKVCKDKKCLFPTKCPNLKLGYPQTINLWKTIRSLPKIKHLFISSGIRYDLLLTPEAKNYLKELCKYHISGQLKIAPEHSEAKVLNLMHKPPIEKLETFVVNFNNQNKLLHKEQFIVNYFICSHPGTTLKDALNLAIYLKQKNIYPEQVQDYIPLPMTLSSCMYHTGIDPFSGKKIYSAKTEKEKKMQRALIQHKIPANKKLVLEALRILNREDLNRLFYPPQNTKKQTHPFQKR